MTTNFTPGPWTVGTSKTYDNYPFRVDDCYGRQVALLALGRESTSSEMAQANARLIAAAPDLYAALAMIADGQDDPAWMRVKAREALAKVDR